LQAIDNGVSKYFIKPLDPDELLEYLVTLIPKLETIHIVELGNNFSYNKAKKQLLNNKSIISLTKRELDFILLLLEQDEYLADNQLIKKALWKEENIPNERVRTFIRRLRNKTSKEFIINNSSLGYSLSLPL
jgi:DNA-binding response OmpR family regulator